MSILPPSSEPLFLAAAPSIVMLRCLPHQRPGQGGRLDRLTVQRLAGGAGSRVNCQGELAVATWLACLLGGSRFPFFGLAVLDPETVCESPPGPPFPWRPRALHDADVRAGTDTLYEQNVLYSSEAPAPSGVVGLLNLLL